MVGQTVSLLRLVFLALTKIGSFAQLTVKHTKTGLRKANLALDRYICKRKQKKKTRDTNSATNATFSIHYCLFLNTYTVLKKGRNLYHTVQKYRNIREQL